LAAVQRLPPVDGMLAKNEYERLPDVLLTNLGSVTVLRPSPGARLFSGAFAGSFFQLINFREH
jgi:hypothetical protein